MKKFRFTPAALLILILAGGCFLYNDYEFDNPYDPDRVAGSTDIASAEGITIDGDTSDWDSIAPIIVDGEGDAEDGGTMPSGSDLYEVKIAEDDNNLYLYFSTWNGAPCQTEDLHLHVNFHGPDLDDEGNNNHLQVLGFSNNGEWGFGYWMGYDNESSNWEWTGIDNPQIRFAGLDNSAGALEVAVYKGSYLEYIDYDELYGMGVDISYEIDDGRSVDEIDEDASPGVVLRSSYQTDPDINGSILNLPTLTPAIDGDNEDWASITPWYTDVAETDDYSQNNSDYSQIYLAQDENFIYAFYTFNDSYGSYDTSLGYNLYVNRSSGIGTSHNIGYDSLFEKWKVSSSHNGIDYFGGGMVAISDSIGMEVRYPKFPGWDDVISGNSQNFSFNINSGGSYDTDSVNMDLLYKTASSGTPVKYHAVQYTGTINSISDQKFHNSDVSAAFTSRAEGNTLNFEISGDHGIELETDGSFPMTIGDTSPYSILDTVDDMVWFRHPDNTPNEIAAQVGGTISFDENTDEHLVIDFNIQDVGATYNISGKLYYYR